MILFFGQGRLGNQLFQYVFLRSVEERRNRIVSCNFRELTELFDPIPRMIVIRNRVLGRLLPRLVEPVLNLLARGRLITSYRVGTYDEGGFQVPDMTYKKSPGLLPLVYVYPCFVQSEALFDQEVAMGLHIKAVFLERAAAYLASLPSGCTRVFVHVRRGDFLQFPVLGKKDVTLPESYYRETIEWFEKNVERPFFIFLTDDPVYVGSTFGDIVNKAISNNPMYVDFAIMTQCEYGIMSNSSFSWWGAYMMQNRRKVFAPRYWLGWRSRVEYHKGIAPSFAEQVEVKG